MLERLHKKAPFVAISLIVALISCLVVSRFVASPEFYKNNLAEPKEKQATVLELSAASAAASAAITLIQGEIRRLPLRTSWQT